MTRQFTTISPTHIERGKRRAWERFREGKYIAIGWLDDVDLTGMSDEQIKTKLVSTQEPIWKYQSDLVRFVNHLKIGDLIAVSNVNHSLFGIGEIISDYEFRNDAHGFSDPDDRYSHSRRVRWLTTTEYKQSQVLRDGDVPWEPHGTLGRIQPSVPEYIWRLLSNEVIEDLSVSLPAVIEEAGEFSSQGGQGFQSDPRRRKAVERYAEDRAITHYQSQRYEVRKVGKPYDLLCRRDGEVLYVEVKGTESSGDYVFLTRNEVEHARNYPMELFVLSKIVTLESESKIVATGGEQRIFQPWKPDDARLVPYAFVYQLR